MNALKTQQYAAGRLIWLALALWLIWAFGAGAAEEQTFALLKTKTETYTNATVTTKAKTYIFILHAGGMNNIKVADLPADVQEKLGYGMAKKARLGTNSAVVWARTEVVKLAPPRMQEEGKKLAQIWQKNKLTYSSLSALVRSKQALTVFGILLLVYLFHCYCCMLICRKTGLEPGILVWLPVVQLFPLIRAAGMSPWWFVAYLVPLLNLVAQVLWSLNIAKARGKSIWVGVLLMVPIAGFFAFLYLAFSEGASPRNDAHEPKVMSLQTA